MTDIIERIREACEGHQYTKEWPHEVLHDAAYEIERLRNAIQDYLDGNYENPRRHRYSDGPTKGCAHGQFYWEGCENCIDEHFAAVLAQGKSHG